jgi:hypothetical protein
LLNEVCELCGYERKYAIKVLSGQRAIVGSNGHKRGGSQTIYGVAEREVIKAIWLAAEQPCGKRLKAALRVMCVKFSKRSDKSWEKGKACSQTPGGRGCGSRSPARAQLRRWRWSQSNRFVNKPSHSP